MAWFVVFLKPATIGWKFAVRIVGRVREIPVVDDWCCRIEAEWFSPVVVRRIRNPRDNDLHAALRLYEKRIPEDQRFPAADIVNWIADDRQIRDGDTDSPRDYFLVAKYKRKVHAFALFHCYPARKVIFFAYMAVEKRVPEPAAGTISNVLIGYVAKLLKRDPRLRNCEFVVFEVEDPRVSTTSGPRDQQLQDIARIKIFCTLAAANGYPSWASILPISSPSSLFLIPQQAARSPCCFSSR